MEREEKKRRRRRRYEEYENEKNSDNQDEDEISLIRKRKRKKKKHKKKQSKEKNDDNNNDNNKNKTSVVASAAAATTTTTTTTTTTNNNNNNNNDNSFFNKTLQSFMFNKPRQTTNNDTTPEEKNKKKRRLRKGMKEKKITQDQRENQIHVTNNTTNSSKTKAIELNKSRRSSPPPPTTNDTVRKLMLNKKTREEEAGLSSMVSSLPPSMAITIDEAQKPLSQTERAKKALGYDPSIRKEGWQNASLFSILGRNEKESDSPGDEMHACSHNNDAGGGDHDHDHGTGTGSACSFNLDKTTHALNKDDAVIVDVIKSQTSDINYDNGDYCFLCWWGDNGEDAVTADVWNKMIQIWTDNVHTMGEEECAAAVSEFQYTRIFKPMQEAGKTVGLFPPEMVIEHFNDHILDPRFEQVSIIRSLKILRHEIEQNIRKQNIHTNESLIDKDQVKNYQSCLKMLREVYTWPVKKMSFYVPQWRIDTESTKSVFSLQREFVFEKQVITKKNKKRRKHI